MIPGNISIQYRVSNTPIRISYNSHKHTRHTTDRSLPPHHSTSSTTYPVSFAHPPHHTGWAADSKASVLHTQHRFRQGNAALLSPEASSTSTRILYYYILFPRCRTTTTTEPAVSRWRPAWCPRLTAPPRPRRSTTRTTTTTTSARGTARWCWTASRSVKVSRTERACRLLVREQPTCTTNGKSIVAWYSYLFIHYYK